MKSKLSQSVLLVIVFIAFSFIQDAAAQNVPENVKTSFTTMYPSITVKEWEFNKAKNWYKAAYKQNNAEYEAYFATDGKWVRTERDIKKADLPQAVTTALAKTEYANWDIDDVEEHQTPQNKTVYVVEVEKSSTELELYILPDGTLLETKKKDSGIL